MNECRKKVAQQKEPLAAAQLIKKKRGLEPKDNYRKKKREIWSSSFYQKYDPP